MSELVDIPKSAIENGVEDFTQAFIFRRMQKLTKPFLKNYESDSEFDEAMQSFINTLSIGASLYAYNKVMNFFFARGVKIAGMLWTYIVAGAMKKKLLDKIKKSKFRGRKAFKMFGAFLGADRTSERIEVAKLVQNNVDSFDKHKMHYENRHDNIEGNFDKFSASVGGLKSSTDTSVLTRFNNKTFTGSWQNTTIDKKLYETATGVSLATGGGLQWSKLYLELNKYNDFSKTVDGEVTNLATTLQKVLNRSGAVSN